MTQPDADPREPGGPEDPQDADRRRLNLPLVLLLVVLVVAGLVAAYLAGRLDTPPVADGASSSSAPTSPDDGGDDGDGGDSGDGGGSAAPTSSGDVPTCLPGPDRPAPTIDLGVQPSVNAADLLPQERVDRLVGLAADAGASVISTSTSWRYVQPTAETRPADFRWTGIDSVVQAARQRGLQVRVQLIGVPRWAVDDPASWTDTTPPTSAAELARWTTFVTEVGRHLAGDVTYLEIWNEPNGEAYWPGGPDPAGFARLLAASYGPVKAVAPDLQVISGGVAANDVGYVETMYQAVEDLAITPQPFDLLGVHPFTGDAAPADVDPQRRYERPPFGLVDDNFAGYSEVHDVAVARGAPGTDLYVGAFGYGTRANRGEPAVPDAERAELATEALEVVTCSPYVRAFSWYYLHPTPFDPVSWTLLDRDLRPTATYEAFVAWAAMVAGSGAPAA